MKWKHTLAIIVALLVVSTAVYALAPLSGVGLQLENQAASPIATGKSGMWGKTSDGLPYFRKTDGTDIAMTGASSAYSTVQDEGVSLTQRNTIDFAGAGVTCADSGGTKTLCTISSGGGGTLATSYAAGSAAADQTMLIQAGDGGPAIFKANGAATGTLVAAQTSAAASLMSIADNAQAYIAGAAADSGTNKGVVTDTKTALTAAGRPYLSVQNGGTEQWSFYTASGVRVIEALAGTDAQIYGNGNLGISGDNGGSESLDLSTGAVQLNSGGTMALLSGAGSLQFGASASQINGPGIELLSSDADGASAVGLEVDTQNAFSTAGSLLLSVRNANTQKMAVDKDGKIIAPAIGTSSAAYHALPTGTGDLCSLDATQTLTNKTITAPAISAPVLSGGLTASGSTAWDFSGSTGTWKPPTGGVAAAIKSSTTILELGTSVAGDSIELTDSASEPRLRSKAATGTYINFTTNLTLSSAGSVVLPASVPMNFGSAASYWSIGYFRHTEHVQAAKPTCAVGAGAGTGSPSCVVETNSTDSKGTVTVTTGTTPTAAATLVTITFNTAFAAAPRCDLSPANALAADNPTKLPFEGTNTTTTLVMTTPTTAYTSADVVAISWDCAGSTSN